MIAIPSFECNAQEQLSRPAALPLPPCAHARLSIGLDRAYCPDCHREFLPKTPEYKSAMLPRAACPLGLAFLPATTKNGSGVPGCGSLSLVDEPQNPTPKLQPEPTPEPFSVIPVVQWVESYPVKRGLHYYYRFRWLDDPDDIRSGGHRHICGGNIHSARALARKAEIENAIALDQSPRQILHLMKSWCSNG